MRNENITTMNISVNDIMKEYAQSQVTNGTYTSTSDYVRDLIRRDMERANKLENLRQLVQEGLESGEAAPLDTEELKANARRKLEEEADQGRLI